MAHPAHPGTTGLRKVVQEIALKLLLSNNRPQSTQIITSCSNLGQGKARKVK